MNGHRDCYYADGYRAGLEAAYAAVDKGGRCEAQVRALIASLDEEEDV